MEGRLRREQLAHSPPPQPHPLQQEPSPTATTQQQAGQPSLTRPMAMASQPCVATATKAGVMFSKDAMALPLDKYDPVLHACWQLGDEPPYRHLVSAFHVLDSTTKRLHIADVLTNMFRSGPCLLWPPPQR